MAPDPSVKSTPSVSDIKEQLERTRDELGDAWRALSKHRHDDPLVEAAARDLLDVQNKLDFAIRKLHRACTPDKPRVESDQLRPPATPTRRQQVEQECLRVVAEARERHGDKICPLLGISPTADPGLAIYGLYQAFLAGKKGAGVPNDPNDRMIIEFLASLKASISRAGNHFSEEVSEIRDGPILYSALPNFSNALTRRGTRHGRRRG